MTLPMVGPGEEKRPYSGTINAIMENEDEENDNDTRKSISDSAAPVNINMIPILDSMS